MGVPHPRFLRLGLAVPLRWSVFSSFEFRISHFEFVAAPQSPIQLASNGPPRQDLVMAATFQPGQLVRVNLAGLDAGGVTFQAAVTDAVAHIVKQTSEQPPKYLVELLFTFRGVPHAEVPADRIYAAKYTG